MASKMSSIMAPVMAAVLDYSDVETTAAPAFPTLALLTPPPKPPPTIVMTDADPPPISSFVIGDLNGKLSEAFAKVTKLHEKQQFAFGVIAGDIFGPDPEEAEVDKILSGNINIPVPIYFALGKHAFPEKVQEKLDANDGELCPNLTCFGRRGIVKTTEGIKVASIGGAHDGSKDQPTSLYNGTYTDADVASLATSQAETGVDLLITSDWPQSITDGSKVSYAGEEKPQGVESLSNLCTALKPRYHFSTSSSYYEREPYFHAGPPPRSVTRFISLAPYGSPGKPKWIYAFSLDTSNEPPKTLEGCTASPFTLTKKRKLDSDANGTGENFRYADGNDHQDRGYERGSRGRNKRQRGPPPTPDECYFCLSRKDAQVHLLVSIATNAYLTVAKGPLTTPDTFKQYGLSIPSHILIIPIAHKPTLESISDNDDRDSTMTEMQQYRTALHNLLTTKSADPTTGTSRLGAVTFSLSQSWGVHLHWQFLPLPTDLINRGLVTAAFETEAENLSYPRFVQGFKDMQAIEETGNYFKVMIWSEQYRKEMVLPLSGDWRFDLQFGRRVVAKWLGLEKRIHWRDCPQSRAEEEAEAGATKEVFEEFDPFR